MIRVTCAVIRNEENDVLIVQRGEATDHPNKWEFPGGKVGEVESEEDCIIREIHEELSMSIVIRGKLPDVEYDYGHKQITLIPFICDTLDELPILSEHIAYKWINVNKLLSVDFSEADVYVAKYYISGTPGQADEEKVIENESIPEDADIQRMVNDMMGRKEAEWIATSAIENPAVFNILFQYSLSSEKRLAFRSSWILTKVCDRFPEIIYPYLSQIIESLPKIENESSLRSFLRIISLSDFDKIDEWQHGLLTDFCFNILNSGFSAIAVKAYSMEILYKTTVKYPELANELATSITILMEEGSAGVTSRGRAILKKLGDMSVDPDK